MAHETRRARLVDRLSEREDIGPETAEAMRAVPRHEFVPDSKREQAYRDTPLPIGQGQTISAPHMVGIMTDLLALSPGDSVLEIGTGCGYHAAVTAAVVGPRNVFSVEYHASLADGAGRTLEATGYGDVSVRTGDGREGWAEHAPYDRAYLTCAAESFPEQVVDQVRPGGLVLGPISRSGRVGPGRQVLVRAERAQDGTLETTDHGRVRFVTLQ